MEEWASGYVADIDYSFGFYRELSPALLAFSALVNGRQAPDPTGGLTYCELGCGQGVTTNILAAANPNIQFYATDFNPGQIAGARSLASQAGLGNAHFYDESFADFAASADLPAAFDIISLHGVYSWISADNRAVIVDFIRRRLKVGGLVYISYNALPGWAPVGPLRQLMSGYAAEVRGPLEKRIGAALDFTEKLMMTRARYFMMNPPVVDRFDRIRAAKVNYVAHEYFNRDWTPFYAADVARDMAEAKLSYVGSAFLTDHIDRFNMTEEQRQFLEEYGDGENRETIKDFLINQHFRRDIFCKGPLPLSPIADTEAWLEQRFVLAKSRTDIPMTATGFLGEIPLEPHIYAPILDAFATGPKSMRDLFAGKNIDQSLWSATREALIALVGLGHLDPCLPGKEDAKRARSSRALNQAILARARENGNLSFLASAVTGSGIPLSRFEQLFLSASQAGHKTPDSWAEFVWTILSSQNQALIKDGAQLQTAQENRAELKRQAAEFAEKKVAWLKTLQIG